MTNVLVPAAAVGAVSYGYMRWKVSPTCTVVTAYLHLRTCLDSSFITLVVRSIVYLL